jgi:hypothetical protein
MSKHSNSGKQQSNEAQLLRGALVPTLIVGLIAIVVSTFIQGLSGFNGALLAQAVVLIYFLVHIFVSKISRNLDPMSTMALAMFSYFAKFLLLGAFLWALTTYTDRSSIDRTSFGVTAIALTPNRPTADGTFSAAVTVKNRGTAPGGRVRRGRPLRTRPCLLPLSERPPAPAQRRSAK